MKAPFALLLAFTCTLYTSGLARAAQIPGGYEFARLSVEAAERAAVLHSPSVAEAAARVDEARATLALARTAGAPQLTAGYAAAPQGGTLGSTIEQSLTTVGAQITLGDTFARSPAVREAQERLLSAEFALQDASRMARVTIVAAYYDALRARATQELRKGALAAAMTDRAAAQTRFRIGDAPRLDVVRADVAIAQATALLEAARVQWQNASEALSVKTGEPASLFAAVVPAPLPALAPALTPNEAVARALAMRPDVAAAQADVAAQTSAVAVARRGALPAVTIGAGYTTGVDSGVRVRGPSANVLVSLPISHVAEDRVAQARARLQEARSRLASLRQQVRLEVSAAARSYAAAARATQAASRAREESAVELHAVEIGYRSGASSSLDVSDARRTYVQAELNELDARYAQAAARATLFVLVGE